MKIADSIELFVYELEKAIEKHPVWPTDPIHACAILTEECGELVRAVNDFYYLHNCKHTQDIEAEAIQVGAMAIIFLINLENYKGRSKDEI